MKKAYTTFEVSRFCHVYPTTVINWIKEGRLASFATPGGHRRILHEDLIQFLRKYNLPFPPDLEKRGPEKRILIVDDELDMTNLIEMMLREESSDWETASVTTGFAAGFKVFEWRPDLILLDFLMPDLNGFEVCRYLGHNSATSHIPIIALTCLTSEEDKKKIFEAGVQDYIAKPFDRHAFLATVRKHLAGKEETLTHAAPPAGRSAR